MIPLTNNPTSPTPSFPENGNGKGTERFEGAVGRILKREIIKETKEGRKKRELPEPLEVRRGERGTLTTLRPQGNYARAHAHTHS